MDEIAQSAMDIRYGRKEQHYLFYITAFWEYKKYEHCGMSYTVDLPSKKVNLNLETVNYYTSRSLWTCDLMCSAGLQLLYCWDREFESP
jgi:hypothetical protein